ncbi:MAG: Siroheme synthase, partial [Verrucomicrobiota bacterium]
GMAAEMPLALISEATLRSQKITITTLSEAEKISAEQIVQPALVVIGEVVALSDFAMRVPGMIRRVSL